ncbi:MAG: hypothetical protein K6F45_10655 [Saccharofermentans sp.]|nr:hypothetical protein [Saccharofermentans sp.]
MESIILLIISGLFYIPFFKKCGLEWWKSFIPGYRMYCRGLCARREKEGRILAFLEVTTYLLALTMLIDGVPGALLLILSLVQVICLIINFVQAIKLNIGTCDIFNRRRTWVLLWMLFADIVALHWGLSKKFQPSRLATDKDEGAEESGITADEEAEGLSVNIAARTARSVQFLTKYTITKWGLTATCAQGQYNYLPMTALWKSMTKMRNGSITAGQLKEFMLASPDFSEDPEMVILLNAIPDDKEIMFDSFITVIESQGGAYAIEMKSAELNQEPKYDSNPAVIKECWEMLALQILLYIGVATAALEFIDKDKR